MGSSAGSDGNGFPSRGLRARTGDRIRRSRTFRRRRNQQLRCRAPEPEPGVGERAILPVVPRVVCGAGATRVRISARTAWERCPTRDPDGDVKARLHRDCPSVGSGAMTVRSRDRNRRAGSFFRTREDIRCNLVPDWGQRHCRLVRLLSQDPLSVGYPGHFVAICCRAV